MDTQSPFAPNKDAVLLEHGYEIKKMLGRGAFGHVYLVFSLHYSQDFVVKILDAPEDNENHISVENEIQTLKNLSHPNIITLYDFFTDDRYCYIILDYCPGGNIANYLRENVKMHKKLLLSFTMQILSALNFCHKKKISHRDIKPENILIDRHGRPVLADFGLSHFNFEEGDQNKQVNQAGSLPFMAPETFSQQYVDLYKADVWSLGITLYKCCFGSLPWDITGYSDMRNAIQIGMITYPPKTNVEFSKFLKCMLATNPNQRDSCESLMLHPIFNMQMNEKVSSNLFIKSSQRQKGNRGQYAGVTKSASSFQKVPRLSAINNIQGHGGLKINHSFCMRQSAGKHRVVGNRRCSDGCLSRSSLIISPAVAPCSPIIGGNL